MRLSGDAKTGYSVGKGPVMDCMIDFLVVLVFFVVFFPFLVDVEFVV